MLCTIIQKPHVVSNRLLTDGTRRLGGGTYCSEVYYYDILILIIHINPACAFECLVVEDSLIELI